MCPSVGGAELLMSKLMIWHGVKRYLLKGAGTKSSSLLGSEIATLLIKSLNY